MKRWITMTACLLAGHAVANTNQLWLLPFTPPTNALSVSDLALAIEQQSVGLAPETHGVRVVVTRPTETVPIRIAGTNVTLLDAVRCLACVSYTELRVADDIALLLPTTTPYRYVIVAVDGRCEDAESGAAIDGIRIKAEWPYESRMYVNTNGYFACGLAKRFMYWADAAALVQTDKESPGTVRFTVSAPGYEESMVTNCFFQDHCGWHGQTFKLSRERPPPDNTQDAIGAPDALLPER